MCDHGQIKDPHQPIAQILSPTEQHWVGDGFCVSTIFSPHNVDANQLSPFILMDHAVPRTFAPASQPRGVGEHPHRGFETVTFAYQGEVAHRDSYGGGGTISSGDVQWMTAASGVVHEEFHSQAFTKRGGIFEMVQLWVNLPAKDKMRCPNYQLLKGDSFPQLTIDDAQARLIAGDFASEKGPAKTHSAITMFDLEFTTTGELQFQLRAGTTTLLVMLRGEGIVQNERAISTGELVVFDRSSVGSIQLAADKGTRALVLNGEPLHESVVAHGPFVMNTRAEIAQAISDYQQGKMGHLQPNKNRCA